MKHLLSLESLSGDEIADLIDYGARLKDQRGDASFRPLQGQSWALMFSKSSTRTRVSFEVGIHELGGNAMFFSSRDTQLGRGEPIEDTARVMGRMVHGAVIRTFAQRDVEVFAEQSGIPTINALTDDEHPCQILADLLTIKEQFGDYRGKKVAFYGDGACNVARSWIWAAEKLDFELVVVAPEGFQPSKEDLSRLTQGRVTVTSDPCLGAKGVNVIYTDVWVSMGKEDEGQDRIEILKPYQVNQEIVQLAEKDAVVMHCLPAYRGNEITSEVLESNADVIFREAENRLHAQKAILARCVGA